MSKVNDFIKSVFQSASMSDSDLKTNNSTPRQLNSDIPLNNQQAIDALMTRIGDDKKSKPASADPNQTKYPPYELSLILPPGKKAIPYEALEINVIKDIFRRSGITISSAAAEAIAEKSPLDFTPKWDNKLKRNVVNEKDGFYYKDFSLGKNSDMVLAGKQKNANGVEFNGYKYYISSELQAAVLGDKDLALDVTKNGKKAFLEKDFNERFGMTLDKALADLPADLRDKLKQIDAKTLLSAVMVGGVMVAALRKLPSEAVAVLAAGLTLKDVIQYGAEANHIADLIGKSTKPGDLPVEELKSLITNGGLDILLAGVGYAGVKLAPKFTKLSKDALKLTDDAAREFGEAYRATKGKAAELANKVDEALSPGMVTPEGIILKPKNVEKPWFESRSNGFPNQRIPSKDGRWTGEVGQSGWESSKPSVRTATGSKPIPYKNGYPVFDEWEVGEVKLPKMRGNHTTDFQDADLLYAKQKGWLKADGTPDFKRVETLRAEKKLTWHHHEDMETMQLVPKDINNEVPHTGGASGVKRKSARNK